jgi:hypothetical protein
MLDIPSQQGRSLDESQGGDQKVHSPDDPAGLLEETLDSAIGLREDFVWIDNPEVSTETQTRSRSRSGSWERQAPAKSSQATNTLIPISSRFKDANNLVAAPGRFL